ncbi:PREDICTED: major antigen isoform X2 [Nelumbo nucifera]|uniref:Major antigen isoform X2 n=1 Tax=Nelumbo nucifera TaxID=4432 RepID=A0A1U8B5H9_NELNU|nr:PREDICTED: major antigen isoform X2 [Nelumbo nucifera]
MALEEEKADTPLLPKAVPTPKNNDPPIVSQASSSHPSHQDTSPPKKIQSARELILSTARKLSAQHLQNSDPGVWGVLTAISKNARKRPQGINILLTAEKHYIGRLVEDKRFQIESHAISANHCKIYRKRLATEDAEQPSCFNCAVFLKDSSTNGTYLNWEKLKKNSPEAKLQHGDIISFAAPPQHELAFSFVYRECSKADTLVDGAVLKRKTEEEFGSESKRLKGIGIGAPEGPISLDDVRSLQRSNTELRKQLESHVLTIETLQKEHRVALVRYENEMKELKESVSQPYLDKIKELHHTLEVKNKELDGVNSLLAERQHAVEDLEQRLRASMQSRNDADAVINNQKASICELEAQLDEERNQRREEREKSEADLKAALQRVQAEGQEELKRQSEVASKQQRELQEAINKLQESDKEKSLLIEASRSKLEGFRESLVISEKKVRQLEAQVKEEQKASAESRKKVEKLEHDVKRSRKELESEKVAREEAWAKVSALELEMADALRDLSIEKQRFQGARERVILRETQLRAFYSTTEEISVLFAKQQEQLKAMQRTLEDEDNYENTYVDIELNGTKGNTSGTVVREKETTAAHRSNSHGKEGSMSSSPRVVRIQVESTSDEASVTEKHDCDIRSQEQHTQDAECMSADRSVKGGFGSEIEGIDTVPVLDGDPIETERVLETESPAIDVNFSERNFDLKKCCYLDQEDKMQLDNDTQVQENEEEILKVHEENANCSQSNNPREVLRSMEDTEAGGTIRTADLLTSEVAGSWAFSTAPSVHGENQSPHSEDCGSARSDGECAAALHCSDGQVAGSQVVASSTATAATKSNAERQKLNEMIKIVAPDCEVQFAGSGYGERDNKVSNSNSDSDTKEGSHHDSDTDDESISATDDTKVGTDQEGRDSEVEPMDESDDATQDDSVG